MSEWLYVLLIAGILLLIYSAKPLLLKSYARTLKVPISFVQILGIMHKSFDPRDVLIVYSFAHRINMPVDLEDVILQAKAGTRIRSVVKAMEMAKKAGVSLDFNEVCKMEREGDTNVFLMVQELLKSKGHVAQ